MVVSPFGTLLADLRQRPPKWTQERLAELAKVGVSTIRRLETGKPKPIEPRLVTVRALADALAEKTGITPEDCRRLLAAFSETASPGEAPSRQDIDDASASVGPPEPVPGPATHAAPPPAWGALADAADQLAQVVYHRWRDELEQRGVHDPAGLPVRWQSASTDLIDLWDGIRGVPLGATADPVDLAGDLDAIAEVYRRIPSGRLVVLGAAGSGKTVLTLRFVLDYVRTRSGADPVPVIFNVESWDPTTTRLRDWLIDRLVRDYPDYPGLAARTAGGSTLAAALVKADRILPVLDGFDEIAPGLRSAALDVLNRTELPLLLTSRSDEYHKAVAASGVLNRAAGVELIDLTPTDLVNYLARVARKAAADNGAGQRETGTGWDSVLAQLRDHPNSPPGANLATALRTPLMAVLARTVYRGSPDHHPTVLLDTARFPTPGAIEEHLLASFVPAVYRHQPPPQSPSGHPRGRQRNWEPERVQRWLGYLAQRVTHHDDRDGHVLAWWQLSDSLRRSARILAVVAASALVTAVADWLIFLPLYIIGSGATFVLGAGLLEGLLIGPVVGLAFGLVHGLLTVFGGTVFEPSRVQLRLLGRRSMTGRRFARTYASRFGAGLLGGFVVGLGYGPVVTVERGLLYGFPPDSAVVIETTLINTLVTGLIFGLAAGLVFGLMSALETPLDIGTAATPVGLLTVNRTTVIRQVLVLVPMLALAIAFGGRLVVGLLQEPLGPLVWNLPGGLLIGTVGGLSGALSYALAFTAWGQWVLLSRVWLPLTGRLPWTVIAFLDDAYHRGVLRQAGAVYQFRHARLQNHLSTAGRRCVSGGRG